MHEYSINTIVLSLMDVVINKTNIMAVMIDRFVHILI